MTFLKNRPHGKKMGTIILVALIVISLAEIIFRAVALREVSFTTSNFGEQLAALALSVTILILAAKGKDRACYICYGAWIGYFVLDQLFELPGFLSTLLATATVTKPIGMVVGILYVVSMIGIIAIGVLLVEYMTDGTIYNKAFNILCVITAVLLLLLALHNIVYDAWALGRTEVILASLHNLSRMTMVFLFTFFAYDAAKAQLKKTDLTQE